MLACRQQSIGQILPERRIICDPVPHMLSDMSKKILERSDKRLELLLSDTGPYIYHCGKRQSVKIVVDISDIESACPRDESIGHCGYDLSPESRTTGQYTLHIPCKSRAHTQGLSKLAKSCYFVFHLRAYHQECQVPCRPGCKINIFGICSWID